MALTDLESIKMSETEAIYLSSGSETQDPDDLPMSDQRFSVFESRSSVGPDIQSSNNSPARTSMVSSTLQESQSINTSASFQSNYMSTSTVPARRTSPPPSFVLESQLPFSQLPMSQIGGSQATPSGSKKDYSPKMLLKISGFSDADIVALRQQAETADAKTIQTIFCPIAFDETYDVLGATVPLYTARRARLKLLTTFVKTVMVTTSNDEHDNMLRNVYSLREVRGKGSSLFPNLERMDVTIHKTYHVDYVEQLLHSSVRYVRLCCSHPPASEIWNARIASLFHHLSKAWKEPEEGPATLILEKLPPLLWPDYILKEIPILPALTTLQGDDTTFSPSLFRLITSSPHLTDFSSTVLYSLMPRFDLLDEPLGSHSFVGLKKVDFTADLPNITALLHQLGPSVESIHLATKCERIDFSDLPKLIPEGAAWLSPNLETFHLSIEETDRETLNYAVYDPDMYDIFIRMKKYPEPRPLSVFPWSTFAPLLSCQGLQTFTFLFHSFHRLSLTDSNILALAEAWQFLQHLTIEWEKPSLLPGFPCSGLADESSLSLSALTHLGLHCPHIRSVKLTSLCAFLIPSPPSLPAPRNHPVDVHLPYAFFGRELDREDLLSFTRLWNRMWPDIRLKVDPWNRDVTKWKRVILAHIETRWGLV